MLSKNEAVFVRHEPDEFLANLIKDVNKNLYSFDITFVAGGAVLTGKVISKTEYVVKLKRAFIAAQEKSGKPHPGIHQKDDPVPVDDDEDYVPRYLHLEDGQLVAGSLNLPYTGLTCWRFRLSEIAGWVIGRTVIG